MNHEEYVILKRLELVNLARGMVSGEVHLIEGVRKLCSLRFEVEDPENKVFLAVRGIESETDHFPLGSKRSTCHAGYLEKMDTEMESYMAEVKKDILQACQEIIQFFS